MLSAKSVYRYDRLDSPAVTAGSDAILIGAQDGLFPDMGYAVPGEMGGLWAGETKLCDGFFFAIDDVPLRRGDAYEASPASSAFHYRMQAEGLHVVRRQFVPDGVRGCVIELTLENLRAAPRMAEVSFTVRTDILTVAAARGEDALELGRDVGEYDEGAQAFFARDSRNPWHVVWGADRESRVLAADLPQEVYGFGNTRGKGVNGRLFYRMRLGARGQATMRLFIVGGYASRSLAEDALAGLRERADALLAQKEARLDAKMARGVASLPDERLARCFNWAKVYSEWLTCTAGRAGMALCADLTENPMLYGENWARAIEGLLPVGLAKEAGEMLETVARLCEEERVAPGRVPRLVSPGGRVLQVGGVRESAQYVSLVYQTLCYGGDRALAERLLAQTGLCMSYLRRATRGFDDVPADVLCDVRAAVSAQAGILLGAGADAGEWEALLSRLPKPQAREALSPEATLAEAAAWHGERDHVEQMVGCLGRMAREGLPGLPGALRGEHDAPGVMLTPVAMADFVWPLSRHLFGLRPDALNRTLAFAPHTPIGWAGWKLSGIAIGSAHFDVTSERISPSQARYTLRADEPGWRVVVTREGEAREALLEGELTLVLGD